MKIDAHQHFWKFNPREYSWIQPDWPIRRDFLPGDLKPLLAQTGQAGSIAVQARQSLEETRWLLELAAQSPLMKGVVGWVDLRSDKVEEQLARFASDEKFVGVRHVVQDEADPDFMLGANFQRGIGMLKAWNLAYDILIYARQLPAALALVRKFPEQRFVLDHLGKPQIKEAVLEPWREQICELARFPNVWCKVSGMITEADHHAWTSQDLRPYLEVAFQAFGENRLMFGSDWPVCLLAGDYGQVLNLVDDYSAGLTSCTRDKLFGGNAAEFYRLR